MLVEAGTDEDESDNDWDECEGRGFEGKVLGSDSMEGYTLGSEHLGKVVSSFFMR